MMIPITIGTEFRTIPSQRKKACKNEKIILSKQSCTNNFIICIIVALCLREERKHNYTIRLIPIPIGNDFQVSLNGLF